ncbi:MAG: HAMP domain-containing histidine kinase [Deltaproteobacteria bacterium]|nr:HAMP domain-containing histidine kinase [Deltaproteobacteria bacterium]
MTPAHTKYEDKLISTISHKLRTPLNSILGFSELLLDQAFGHLNEKQRHYLNNINKSGEALLALLNDLIDLMNVKWGDIQVQYSAFPLNNAIGNAVQSIQQFADLKNISLEIQSDPRIETIKADEPKIEKILHYLLSNAVKFTPSGGQVKITTKYLDRPPSRLSSSGFQNFVEVSVTDTGIGIQPNDQEKIFSEFYQVNSTQSQEFEGTGLGLSVARDLITMHHGDIWVESEEGKGSRFIFTIPLPD